MKKVYVLKSHGSQWGPGKIHYESSLDGHPICTPTKSIHAEPVEGTIEDVTCKRCIKEYWPK